MSGHAVISELHELEEMRELERLFAAIWERPGEPPFSSDLMRALAHSGNYVAGAHDQTRLVGGLVGWLGGTPPHETVGAFAEDMKLGLTIGLHLHSHILGVVVDSQVHGLGFELKQHQRRWCLERGIKVIEWTFDPLVRRNAHFNLTKLGARAHRYLVNFYGEMADGLNAGEESDRILIRWHLDSAQAESAAARSVSEPSVEQLLSDGASIVLSVGQGGEPVGGPTSAGVLLFQVPEDIVAVRRADPALAHSWRLAVRRAMGSALDTGYVVSGATRAGWYVLER